MLPEKKVCVFFFLPRGIFVEAVGKFSFLPRSVESCLWNVGKTVKNLSVTDVLNDVVYHSLHVRVVLQVFFHLADGIDHSGVIPAAEGLSHLYHGHLGDFTDDIHGNLPGGRNIRIPFLRADIFRGDAAVSAGHLLNNLIHCDGSRLIVINDVADSRLGGSYIDGLRFQ